MGVQIGYKIVNFLCFHCHTPDPVLIFKLCLGLETQNKTGQHFRNAAKSKDFCFCKGTLFPDLIGDGKPHYITLPQRKHNTGKRDSG